MMLRFTLFAAADELIDTLFRAFIFARYFIITLIAVRHFRFFC